MACSSLTTQDEQSERFEQSESEKTAYFDMPTRVSTPENTTKDENSTASTTPNFDRMSVEDPARQHLEKDDALKRQQHHLLFHPVLHDLDQFLAHCYDCHTFGGALNFALYQFSFILKYVVTLVLMFVVVYCIDYARLASFVSASSSSMPQNGAVRNVELGEFVYWGANAPMGAFSFMMFLGFLGHLLYSIVASVRSAHALLIVGKFFRIVLSIHDDELQTCQWHVVASRLRLSTKIKHFTR